MLTRTNKYGARQTVALGRRFDSRAEADRGVELTLLERAGEIQDLVFQPRVELEPSIFWKLDFAYQERGRPVYEDVKGIITREAALKIKLWRLHGPALLRILKRAGAMRGFKVVKEIMPGVQR